MTEDINSLVAGSYTVTITDANGCTTTNAATVLQPDAPITLEITAQTDIVCDALGSVTVLASGGTAPYNYNIDGGVAQNNGTFNNLESGNYTVNVIDTNGCTESIFVTILENCTIAINDINDTFVNVPVTGNVLTNDFDLENDTQTVTTTTVTTDQGVTVTIDANTGAYLYTPLTDFEGEDRFTYTVCDNGNPQACDTATVTIEVVNKPIEDNDPPIANNDTALTQVNVPVTGNVLVNDYDLDNDPIVVTTTTVTTNLGVIVTIDPNTGVYTYTPPIDYTGEDLFSYTICDDADPALCDDAIVHIQVIGDDNNVTVANDDSYYVEIDTTLNKNVLINDTDLENDNQTVTSTTVTTLAGVTVTIAPDGSFTYTPLLGFIGADQFIYNIEDDNPSGTATDRATVYILVAQTPAPSIALIKEGDFDGFENGICTAMEGDTITYTFTVTNIGNVTLTDILVTDPLVDVGGTAIATLAPGASDSATFTATYAITQADIDAGMFTNQATATGTAPDGSDVSDLSDDDSNFEDGPTVTDLCQDAAIAIIKVGAFNDNDADGCSTAGVDTVSYTFTVSNEGNVSLSDIAVIDSIVPVVTFISGDDDGDSELDVDEAWIYTGDYNVTQADIDTGSVTNQAEATGTGPNGAQVSDLSDGSVVTEDGPTVTDLCQDAAIAIIKVGAFNDNDADGCSTAGVDTVSYTFTVSNEGNVSLSDIAVIDSIVPVVTFISGDDDGDSELDVDEAWIYTGDYNVTQDDIDTGSITNQAEATGTGPNGAQVSDLSDGSVVTEDGPTVTDLCQDAAIAIIKVGAFNDNDADGCSTAGVDTVSYTFTVSNEGNVSLNDIAVIDSIVPVVTFISGDDDGDSELDVDEAWIYTGDYNVTQADIDTGSITNQAEATGTGPNGAQVSDLSDGSVVTEDGPTVTDLCQDAAIAIIKVGTFNDNDADGCSTAGVDTVSYTFTVSNEGNVSLSDIAVIDSIVPVVTFISGDDDGDSELDVDEAWIYTGDYNVTQADIDTGSITNQAEATGTGPNGAQVSDLSDGSVVTEDGPTVTDLCQDAAIAIIKVGAFNDNDADGCSTAGVDTVSYTFTVSNEGNVSLSDIAVIDSIVPVVTFISGDDDGDSELDVDEAWVYTGDYNVTQADIDTGSITNQAEATGTGPNGAQVSDLSDGSVVTEDDPTVTDLCQNPAIALIKVGILNDEDGDGCTGVGETITYTFGVINSGNQVLTNITVTDPLVTVDGGPITLNPGDGDDTTFTATYIVTQEDVDNGFVMNQATVEGTAPNGDIVFDLSDDDTSLEDNPTVSELCQFQSLSLEKAGIFNDDNGDEIPQVGETISYTFSVTNTGNVTLFNITINDPLPGIVVEGGSIDVLLPGEEDSTTFTATYTLTEADIDTGEVVNQAIATGEDGNGNIAEDESDDPNDLENVDNNNDGEPDDPTVTIIPNVGGTQFNIFNGVTPNGDGLNDFFEIRGISEFPNNNVKIFNRWGVLVWETDGYDEENNVFRGISNGRSTIAEDQELPTGTYFYILTFPDENPSGRGTYNGYLYINR